MKPTVLNSIILLIVCFLFAFAFTPMGETQWSEPQQITYNGMEDLVMGAGQHSLVLDSQSYAHLIFWAGSGLTLPQIFYATNVSGDWQQPRQLTNTPLYMNMMSDIAIDHHGSLHAVWLSSYKPRYATNTSGIWEITEIPEIFSSMYSCIGIDSNQKAHIVLTNPYPGVTYLTNMSGEWISENIALGVSNEMPSIGIDPSNGIHVAWLRGDSEDSFQIFYGTNISDQWFVTQLTSSSRGVEPPSLCINENGFIYIVWTELVDDTTAQLFYATDESGHWESIQVTNTPGYKYTPSLAVDPFDYLHIAWVGNSGTSNQLNYANNINGFWITEQVPLSDSTCRYPNIAVDTDTSVHIAYCSSLDGGDLDIFYLKHLGRVAIEDVSTSQTIRRFHLRPNYPNPFNPSTTITYQLPKDCKVSLTIYNILGQQVYTLIDEWQSAGYYSTLWDGRTKEGVSAASGVYFYRIQAGEFVETKKMLLLK